MYLFGALLTLAGALTLTAFGRPVLSPQGDESGTETNGFNHLRNPGCAELLENGHILLCEKNQTAK